MKKSVFVTLALCMLFSVAVAQQFEGVIEMQIKGQNQESSMPMKYMVKGDFVRTESQTPRGEFAMIMNMKERKMIMLMPQMNSYMERTIDSVAPPPEGSKKPEFTKTGKSEKILGYDCEQYVVKEDNWETEIWAAKGLGTFMRPRMGGPMGGGRGGMGRGGQTPAAWEEEIRAKGFFPLRTLTRNAEGKEEARMEVTKIEKKALDASLFKAPEGWQKMEMPMMGRPRN
ncbi:MAG: DUF4412 domain-containing protein [Ignavibacteriales bacterium]|nr:DUF4412 domain-containing protein [Ignavibacteriales bacterium]